MTPKKEKEYFENLYRSIKYTQEDLETALRKETDSEREWRLRKESDPDDTVYKTWCLYQKFNQDVRSLSALLKALQIEAQEHFYVIEIFYSDHICWEICERKSTNKFIIRRMKAIKKSGENGNNIFELKSDPNGELLEINRRKNGYVWGKGNRRFVLSDKPEEYHNFHL